jgi:hypothetical protein
MKENSARYVGLEKAVGIQDKIALKGQYYTCKTSENSFRESYC